MIDIGTYIWAYRLDLLAFVGLVLCWVGYYAYSKRTSVDDHMHEMRRQWMSSLLLRDVRIVDAQIHASLMNGVGFFASTSLVLLGGLLAMLGGQGTVFEQVAKWSFLGPTPVWLLEGKLLTLMALFVYAFFKFAWSYRLFNYVAICIGALPPIEVERIEPIDHDEAVESLATLHAIAGRHFNRGLRSFYFGVAVLGWFVHPLLMLLMTFGVAAVLYRRDYRSKFGVSVQRLQKALQPDSTQTQSEQA